MGIVLPLNILPGSEAKSTTFASRLLPGAIAQGNAQLKSQLTFWQRRPKRPLTIRGVICVISPGLIETLMVWHTRPVFIWQGKGNQIRVRDYNQRDRVLWETSVMGESIIAYGGSEALQSGQLYQWQVIATDATPSHRPSEDKNWTTFRLMSAKQHQEISTPLQVLEQRLQQQNASMEDIALSKANFFADRGLWSDALQVIAEVNNPSPQFAQQRSTYLQSLCAATK